MERDIRDPKEVGRALLNELEGIRQDAKAKPWLGVPQAPTLSAADLLARYEIPDYDGSNDIKTAAPPGGEH